MPSLNKKRKSLAANGSIWQQSAGFGGKTASGRRKLQMTAEIVHMPPKAVTSGDPIHVHIYMYAAKFRGLITPAFDHLPMEID